MNNKVTLRPNGVKLRETRKNQDTNEIKTYKTSPQPYKPDNPSRISGKRIVLNETMVILYHRLSSKSSSIDINRPITKGCPFFQNMIWRISKYSKTGAICQAPHGSSRITAYGSRKHRIYSEFFFAQRYASCTPDSAFAFGILYSIIQWHGSMATELVPIDQ